MDRSAAPLLDDSAPYCLSYQDILCDFNAYSVFFESKDVPKTCSECPRECSRIYYAPSISHTSFPTMKYYKRLLENQRILSEFGRNASMITYDQIKRTILSLDIYYDMLEYISIEETEKTSIIDLVSNVGGTLGL